MCGLVSVVIFIIIWLTARRMSSKIGIGTVSNQVGFITHDYERAGQTSTPNNNNYGDIKFLYICAVRHTKLWPIVCPRICDSRHSNVSVALEN